MKNCSSWYRKASFCFIVVLALTGLPFLSSSYALTIDSFDSEGIPVYLDESIKTNPDQYAREMEEALMQGNLDSILAIGEHLVKIRPEDGKVRALYAIGLASKGKTDRAREELSAIQNGKPSKVYRLCAEAMILKATGKTDPAVALCKQAIAAAGQHPYPYNILGRLYTEKGRNKDALEAFKKALALNPNFLPAYANIGTIYYLNRDYPSAMGYFSEGIRRSPGFFNAHYGLAASMEAVGDIPGAIAHYAESLRLDPGNRESLVQLAALQLKNGMFPEALANARKMELQKLEGADAIIADAALHLNDLETASDYIEKLDDQTPDKAFLQGYADLIKGRYEPARRSMGRVLELVPNHFGAFSTRMAIDFYLGKSDSLSDSQINQWGDGPAKLLNFFAGAAAADRGDWQGAHQKWVRAEGLFSGFSMEGISKKDLKNGLDREELKHLNMGSVLYLRNFFPNALVEFEAGIKQNPSSIFSNYFAGHLQLKMGHRQEAAARFEKAADNAPNFFSTLYAAGEIQATLGNFDLAISLYNRASQTKADPGLLIKLGLLNEMQGNYTEAERMYRKTTQLAPDNFIGYNQLAWLYAKQGIKLDDAIALAKKADRLQPGNASIQDTLGWAYFLKKDNAKALQHLEAAQKVNPDNPTILYHLGSAYHATGKIDAARKALTAALENSSGFDEADAAKKLLSELK